MKLRITVGEANLESHVSTDQMETLYQSSNLVIQGDHDIRTIVLDDGRTAFLAGHLVGMRSAQGDVAPCTHSSTSLKELLRTNSIEECRERLEGRFLLAVAGPGDVCRICADRYGRRDLYYQITEGPIVFSSDLSLLTDSPGQDGFDQAGLAHALTVFGYRPPKRHTYYKGICRLGVRQCIRIDQGRAEFSEAPFQPCRMADYGERELNEYADLLLDAVRVRGSRYGNVVYLSSGWDSTSILACLVHLFGASKVRAVIGRMQYAERSGVINQFELDRARAIADYYNVRLETVEFDFRHRIPKTFERLQPLMRSHDIASMTILTHGILADFFVSTTDGCEAVFAGEISDGAHNLGFSQYTTIFHPDMGFREYSDKMASYLFGPTFLGLLQNGQFVEDPIYNLFRERTGGAIFNEPARGTESDRSRQLLASFFLRANRLPLWSLRNSKMLTEGGGALYSEEMESTYLEQAAVAASPDTLYAWYLHLYNSFHWQGSTVATLDLTAEANGFDMALPFWDSRIQEFLSAMPESWGRGLDLNPTKYPLKWMLQNRMDYPMHLQTGPHSYLYDVDPSFSHSAEILYESAFAPYFRDRIRSRAYRDLLTPDLFNLDYIDGIVKRYLDGIEVRGVEMNDLFSICTLSMVGLNGD